MKLSLISLVAATAAVVCTGAKPFRGITAVEDDDDSIQLGGQEDDDDNIQLGAGVDIESSSSDRKNNVQFDHSNIQVGYFLKKHESFVFLEDPTIHKMSKEDKKKLKQAEKERKALKKLHKKTQSERTFEQLMDDSSHFPIGHAQSAPNLHTPGRKGILKASPEITAVEPEEEMDLEWKQYLQNLRTQSQIKSELMGLKKKATRQKLTTEEDERFFALREVYYNLIEQTTEFKEKNK